MYKGKLAAACPRATAGGRGRTSWLGKKYGRRCLNGSVQHNIFFPLIIFFL